MLKLYDLICPKCKLSQEELIEYDSEKSVPLEEVLCPACGIPMVPDLQKPAHGKHLKLGDLAS